MAKLLELRPLGLVNKTSLYRQTGIISMLISTLQQYLIN